MGVIFMDYKELVENARKCLGKCHGCPICNGVACRNTIPGPGAKGVGDTAIRNYQAWQTVRVVMDTLCEKRETDTRLSLFGHSFAYPFLPVLLVRLPCTTVINIMM